MCPVETVSTDGRTWSISRDDLHALRSLTIAYARRLDRTAPGDVEALFTPDGVWDGRPAGFERFEGAEALSVCFAQHKADVVQSATIATNQLVAPFDGDEAAGWSYCRATTLLRSGSTRHDFLRISDVFARVDQVWYFRQRVLTPLMPARLQPGQFP